MEILEIAKYEFMLLRRSMRFKIMTVLYIAVIGVVNVGIAFLNRNGASPMITSLSGFPPYLSFYLFSFISAITIPFIIGNFLIDDKKGRVDGVIYSKPTSSLRYIIGKFIGSVSTLITIALIIMFISSAIQISIAVRPFDIMSYITSFILICLPTIIFLSGFVFALNFILRSRILVFLVIIGFSTFCIFIIGDKAYRLLDFPALTLPLNPSDIMGYGDITNEIIQRIAYIFIGLSLVLLSAVFPFRLIETKYFSIKMLAVSIVSFLISLLLFTIIINSISIDRKIRKHTLITHDKYSEFPLVKIDHYDMNIAFFPSKHRLKADVKMNISYLQEKADKLIFVLNSGLKINKIADENDSEIPYKHEYSILAVDVKTLNNPPEQINISYEGKINENSFYLIEERKEEIFIEFASIKIPQLRWNVGDCSSWIGNGCIFLIPESRWYPTPGVDYKENIRISKPTNFSTAKISIVVPEKFKTVTQGSLIDTKEEKNKITYTYKTDIPVPQFSINAGEYIVKHTEVDSINFYAYYSPIHRRYAEFFTDTSNVVDKTIKELKEWIETETTLKYPYPSFSLVEVPLDFRTYFETYEDFNPTVQPGVILIPENNINLGCVQYINNFNSSKDRAKRRGDDFNISERKKFYFINYLASNLAGSVKFGWGEISRGDFPEDYSNIISEYWGFQIGSKDKFSSLIRKGINRQVPLLLGGNRGEFFVVNKSQLYDAIETKPLTEFSPDKDGILYDRVMQLKCPAIMKSLCQEVGEDKYKEIIIGFVEKYKYKNASFEDFKRFVEEISGKRLDAFFNQWLNTSQLPGYTIIKAEAYPLVTKEMKTQYQMKVRIRNWEEGHGNIKVHFKTEKDDIYKDVSFESREEKEIGEVVPDKPQFVEIDPIFAKNWSNPRFNYTLPEKPVDSVPFEGTKTVISEKSNEIIVDDQDEGFSIVRTKKDNLRFFRREEDESNVKEGFDSLSDFIFTGVNTWIRIYYPQSFGKFRNSLIAKNKGKGETNAVWRTLIPEDGFYETYIFVYNYTRNMQLIGEGIGSVFHITVTHNAGENDIELKTSRNMDGWHYLGEFEYNKGDTAEIRLSDKCDGLVIADAVKWVPAD